MFVCVCGGGGGCTNLGGRPLRLGLGELPMLLRLSGGACGRSLLILAGLLSRSRREDIFLS